MFYNRKYIFLSALLVALFGWLFFTKVDLSPKVTADFFFASVSPAYVENQKIIEEFPESEQLLVSISGKIRTPEYADRLEDFCDDVEDVDNVESITSATHGPNEFEDIFTHPLWQRVVLGSNKNSTTAIISAQDADFQQIIEDIQPIIDEYASADFRITLSGVPYIVGQIADNLTSDINVFSLTAIILFAVAVLLIFRSILLALAVGVTFITASMATLYMQSLLGFPVGILTANLATMVFILTISHMVYITSNYRNMGNVGDAVRYTFPASFWCMITTLLGFLSLLMVDAKPLRELGAGGALGTVIAIICAYVIFPPILNFVKLSAKNTLDISNKIFAINRRRFTILMGSIVITYAFMLGMFKVSTDPSLLDYFKEGKPLHKGLSQIDEDGGSSPLKIVFMREDEDFLDTDESFEMMNKLQAELELHSATGSILSLPILMQEVLASGYSSDYGWDTILSVLSGSKYNNIGLGYVDFMREKGVFMIRMREGERTQSRDEVLADINNIFSNNGFKIDMIGGAYRLQAELAKDISSSMVTGIAALVAFFAIIGFIVSRNIWVSLAITISVAVIAILILGLVGAISIPLDIISAPAVNVCIGIAIDTLIHLTLAVKRDAAGGLRYLASWKEGIRSQSGAAITSALIILLGFSVFLLSTFPPTSRFGVEIIFGTIVTIFVAFVLYPTISTLLAKRK